MIRHGSARLDRLARGLVPVILALATAVHAAPAAAQYREENAGRVGAGGVVRVFENNRFARCLAMFFDGNRNMLRIAFTRDRKYSMSVPPVTAPRGAPLIIAVSAAGSGTHASDAVTNGQRAWTELPLPTVEAMMRFRGPLIVQAGTSRFQWSLGAPVQEVLVAVENCTNRATGWR